MTKPWRRWRRFAFTWIASFLAGYLTGGNMAFAASWARGGYIIGGPAPAVAAAGGGGGSLTWTNQGNFAATHNASSSQFLVLTTTGTLDAFHLGICMVAVDNGSGTTDANDITSSTDSVTGSTWNKAVGNIVDISGAATGASLGMFWLFPSVNIATGSLITIKFSSARTAKGAVCQEWVPNSAGVTISTPIASTTEDVPAGSAGQLTQSGLTSGNSYLTCRAEAQESRNASISAVTSNFTVTLSTTQDQGSASTSMGVGAECRQANNVTVFNSSPTWTTNTVDQAGGMATWMQQ